MKKETQPPQPTAEPGGRIKINIPAGTPAEIVAVIATVLEIELKLQDHSRPGRFTFTRGEPGWSEYGRSLIPAHRGGNRS